MAVDSATLDTVCHVERPWPGDASFGGSFGGSFDPASLPVHQYISWAQYSSWDIPQKELDSPLKRAIEDP